MGFATFWQMYPRKVARKAAEKSWRKLSTDEQQLALQALPLHIQYWTAAGTEKQYMPYPGSWLNQARWEDELEMPQPQKREIVSGWWHSEPATLEMARKVDINPRPSESWSDLRDRIRARLSA
jgi:hypothetical protein